MAKTVYVNSIPVSMFQADITRITDSSGGTASDTIAAITGGGSNCENATKNAIASLAAKVDDLQDALDSAGITV